MNLKRCHYFLQSTRPAHWSKNFLVFLPLIFAQLFFSCDAWVSSIQSFWIFTMAAAAIYGLNDFFDLSEDSHHPEKCKRPLACALITSKDQITFSTFLLFCSLFAAVWMSMSAFMVLLVYIFLNYLYTIKLKKLILIDVFCLAFFFLLRIIFAGAVSGIEISPWLIGLTWLGFCHLGILKRVMELGRYRRSFGRCYQYKHQKMLLVMALTSYLSIITLLIFFLRYGIKSELYSHPQYLWGCLLLVSLWFPLQWMMANDKRKSDDPVTMALVSYRSWALVSGVVFLWWKAW